MPAIDLNVFAVTSGVMSRSIRSTAFAARLYPHARWLSPATADMSYSRPANSRLTSLIARVLIYHFGSSARWDNHVGR